MLTIYTRGIRYLSHNHLLDKAEGPFYIGKVS